MDIIISHVNADFDSLASMVAAQKLYPNARMYFSGTPEQNVREFMSLHKHLFNIGTPRDFEKEAVQVRRLIIVDCRIPSRLGEFRSLVNNPQIEVHIYDHHPPTQEAILGDFNAVEMLGASVTSLIKRIREAQLEITPLEATLFALGIYEETGSLSFTTTTWEDAEAVAWLLKNGANLSVISSFIYHPLREEQKELLNRLILSSAAHNIQGYKIVIAKATVDKYTNDIAIITHRLRDLERCDAIFTIVKISDRSYIVGRSLQAEINVGKILENFGGGGHPTAASAAVKNQELEQIEAALLQALRDAVQPPLYARDIMSRPVHYLELEYNPTLRDAQEAMMLYGHSALLVLENKKLVGVITRRDLDKAMHHGYGSAPLRAYMSKIQVHASPDTSIKEVIGIMREKNIGRIPILDKGSLVGIITRSDILKSMHSGDLIAVPVQERRSEDMLRRLPDHILDILVKCGDVGDELGYATYVVGGFVRDLLLNVENFDIDIVVEGDGIAFAYRLAKTLGGRVRSHEKFGTAIVILPDGFKIDIATSRVEFYTRPAALPEVTGSSIKQDLFRRDFSINTMAITLNRREFGKLIDFFGARRDLKMGIVRVLHNLSFIEDPTRIFRAIRFEQRYQFKMDQNTENLLKTAQAINIFREVASERLRDEFIIILSEPRPLPALKRMEQLKILKLIHPKISLNSKVVEILEDITATLVSYAQLIEKEKLERWIIYFSGLVSQLSIEQIQEIGGKFRVTAQQLKKITFDRQYATEVIRTLSERELKPSAVYLTLEHLSLEVILYLLARSKNRQVKQKINLYLNKLRSLSRIVQGKDLKEWGEQEGPHFKEVLDQLFVAQLDGEFKDKKGAREYYTRRFL
jgi:tRNA nucleotidyltransferase (CCA-adding enzyme)